MPRHGEEAQEVLCCPSITLYIVLCCASPSPAAVVAVLKGVLWLGTAGNVSLRLTPFLRVSKLPPKASGNTLSAFVARKLQS